MFKLKGLLAAIFLCVASPALADEYFAVTPTGMAETLFSDKPVAAIGKLTSKCIDAHWTVISSSATELVCEAPLNFGQSLLGQLTMGNSYSTPPRRFFRFNVAEINGISRVQASGWMELQMAFGQMKRTDFSGPEFQNSIMQFMLAAGGKYPLGTSFPNHAWLGIQAEDASLGKYVGIRIKSVEPGGAAATAGLQVGDVVNQIVGKRFKDMGDYLDATAKAAKTPVYEVQLTRDGKPMKVSAARAFRPAITEAVVALAAPSGAPVPVAGPTAPIADELTKLAKLKADGILTDAEFQAQKAKLLGQE
ncbi:SHOCT domain-containing protein [Sphingomonas sp. IC-56]|uniref:SHOCT domain-containing protein n=1 Tax=Sphingomonas sp. IC-56 TaxID=2898529 RepID=UPI001E613A16|nr:SHOCT domain-containing protein [Sphingomonas sp. IC-56]MCD2324988.1 SHOCT domain-containing protein [Sphingomonas sp. IC-56]